MGDPIGVTVSATDPVLEAGVISALRRCPDVAVLDPDGSAAVTVVIADGVDPEALERGPRGGAQRCRPEVVLVATDMTAADAQRAIAARRRRVLRRREVNPDGSPAPCSPLPAGTARCPRTCCTGSSRRGGRPAGPAARGRPDATASATGSGRCDPRRGGHETIEIARELSYSIRSSPRWCTTHPRFRCANGRPRGRVRAADGSCC
jgi:hypothetical protein